MALSVVKEVELESPERELEAAPTLPRERTERQSAHSFALSTETSRMLNEIRMVLNARVTALLAAMGAFLIALWAMWLGTGMSLWVALSYDIMVFIPMAFIAYLKPK